MATAVEAASYDSIADSLVVAASLVVAVAGTALFVVVAGSGEYAAVATGSSVEQAVVDVAAVHVDVATEVVVAETIAGTAVTDAVAVESFVAAAS